MSYLGKLSLLLAAMPFHVFVGISLVRSATVIGGGFYRSLGLPSVPDLLADQRLGAAIVWALGELPMVVAMIVLLVQWAHTDARENPRFDRRCDLDDEAELAEHYELLARLAHRNNSR
jgi:cytochrome c oxidase assembly factor CtaG